MSWEERAVGEQSKATNVVRGCGQGSSLKADLKAEQGSTGDQREIVSGEADSFLSAFAQQRNSGCSGSTGSATVQSTRCISVGGPPAQQLKNLAGYPRICKWYLPQKGGQRP